jgi:hypothetical protein
MGKVHIPRKLIPAWVDHNNKFFPIKDYYVHQDTGDIYSTKMGSLNKIKSSTNRGWIGGATGKHYPFVTFIDPSFSDLYRLQKRVSNHKVLITSYIFHYNILKEELKKAFKYISERGLKALDKLPIWVLEEMYRGLIVNHIDHDKQNHNRNNLELTTYQGNAKANTKHKNKTPYISLIKKMRYEKTYGKPALC